MRRRSIALVSSWSDAQNARAGNAMVATGRSEGKKLITTNASDGEGNDVEKE